MNSAGYDFFTGSTLQFLAKGTSNRMHVTTAVTPATSFGDVVNVLAREHIHRVYIQDDYGHPLGCVSLIDVIARF